MEMQRFASDQAKLSLQDLGSAFSAYSLSIVIGDDQALKKYAPSAFRLKQQSQKDFKKLQESIIHNMAKILSVRNNECNQLLEKYEEQNSVDALRLRSNISMALKLDSVKLAIDEISDHNPSATNYWSLWINYRLTAPAQDLLSSLVHSQIFYSALKISLFPLTLGGCEDSAGFSRPRKKDVPHKVNKTYWQEPDISYNNLRHVFALVNVPADQPLQITRRDGSAAEISGELIYIRAGHSGTITIEGNPDQNVLNAYYDPVNKVFYCAVDGNYWEVNKDKVKLKEQGQTLKWNDIEMDWDAFLGFIHHSNSVLNEIRDNYFYNLKKGAESISLSMPRPIPNEEKIGSKLKAVGFVFSRDVYYMGGGAAYANYPNEILLPHSNDINAINYSTLVHEFTHLFLDNAEALSLGTPDSPFGGRLLEGETAFFSALVERGVSGSGFKAGVYEQGAYVIATYAFLLGGTKFFQTCLDPANHDLDNEMDQLLGEPGKHAKMRAYFRAGLPEDAPIDTLTSFLGFTFRLLGELEKKGIDWKDAIESVEPLFRPRMFPNLTFFERFGAKEDTPLLVQAQNGTQYLGFEYPAIPFDVRDALENPPERLGPILQSVPILNSLDYESYDIPTQQIALGVWRNVVESFVEYWNYLTPAERLDSQNQADLNWFVKVSFSLAARFGFTLTNIYDFLSYALGTDAPIEIHENSYCNHDRSMGLGYPTRTLHLSSLIVDQPYNGSLAGTIEYSEATLISTDNPWSTSKSWKLERSFSLGGKKTWKLSLYSEGTITLRFGDGSVEIRGLEVKENGLEE